MNARGGREAIDEATLHAFLDGELSPERAAEVEAALATQADLAARVEAWRSQKALLKAALDPILAEPTPGRLAAVLDGGRRSRPGLMRIAAALALFLAGGVSGMAVDHYGAAPSRLAAAADQAFGAYAVYAPEQRHPVEVAASEVDHLNAWLSNRLGRAVAAPDLSAAGYALIGGRLLAAGERPVALFMYDGPAGERAALLVQSGERDGPPTDGFSIHRRGQVSAVAWATDGMEKVLIGARAPEALETAARAIDSF